MQNSSRIRYKKRSYSKGIITNPNDSYIRLRVPHSRSKKKKTRQKNPFFGALKDNTRKRLMQEQDSPRRNNYLFKSKVRQTDTPVSFQAFNFEKQALNQFDLDQRNTTNTKNSNVMIPIDIDCLSENQLMNLKSKIDSKLTVMTSSKGSSKRYSTNNNNPFVMTNSNIKGNLIYRPNKNKILAKELDFMKDTSRDTSTTNDIDISGLRDTKATGDSKLIYTPTQALLMDMETPLDSGRLSIGGLFVKKKKKKKSIKSSGSKKKPPRIRTGQKMRERLDNDRDKLRLDFIPLDSEEREFGTLDSNKTVRLINQKIREMETELNLLGRMKKI